MFKTTCRSPVILVAMLALLVGLNGNIDPAALVIVGFVVLGLSITFAMVSKIRERNLQPPSLNH